MKIESATVKEGKASWLLHLERIVCTWKILWMATYMTKWNHDNKKFQACERIWCIGTQFNIAKLHFVIMLVQAKKKVVFRALKVGRSSDILPTNTHTSFTVCHWKEHGKYRQYAIGRTWQYDLPWLQQDIYFTTGQGFYIRRTFLKNNNIPIVLLHALRFDWKGKPFKATIRKHRVV